ncbi:hypothetical protein PR048_014426 [Dryococelus australis]|uniref:Uncharacterized protein n=1 Tax=Dryococelus australis TaxID=614101 RepID=A0ABQ9HE48_9NEOP|nr:hypothetical protein PR048_014426 [Dryococelus australis]
MKDIFAGHGIPQMVHSYIIGIPELATEYGFNHRTFSPQFPLSNGEAEKAVHIAKHILSKSEDPNLGILSYRSTRLESGLSQAELLFGQKLRNTLPVIQPQL